MSMIFYKTPNSMTSTTVTAAIMIFMQAIVSVGTTKAGGHIQPDMVITTTKTWTNNLFDISKNPVLATQPTKISTKPHIHRSTLSTLNSFDMMPSEAEILAQPTFTTRGDCKSLTDAWGDVDPNVFYICETRTKKPLQLRCPTGKGFFLGLGYSGCIPFEQWPACISNNTLGQVMLCDSEHMQQVWPSMNPNKFYVCLKENVEPIMLNCAPGRGFVHVIITASGVGSGVIGTTPSKIVGCADWENWRHYMHCNDYY